jgi:protein TonB
VAVVAVLGTAWFVGLPSIPAPAPLYVDLVHPVVATSDRHGPPDAPALRLRIASSRASAAAPTPPAAADVTRRVDPPSVEFIAPMVEPEGPASTSPAEPGPPTVPVPAVPGPAVARPESTPAAEPVSQRPSPADIVTNSPASDTAPTASRRIVVAGLPEAPPSSLADDRLSTPSSGSTAQRPSRGPGPGEPAGPLEPGQPRQIAAAVPAPGGQPAAAGGARLARVPSDEARGNGAPDGAIPPEYESYVRSLRQRVQERLAYPWTAVRHGQQGVVELEVRVGADGRLVAVEVVLGSNAETLRAAAVAAVRGSAPVPFPPGLAARPLVIRLPVEFRLR